MRILLLVHGYPPAPGGGTEAYTAALSTALAAGSHDDVFVLTRDADPNRPEYSVRREHRGRVSLLRINNTFQACCSFEDSYLNPELARRASALIDEIQPDVAHVQHLTCLSTSILAPLADRGVPIVMTLNDYWLICHRGQLVNLDGTRCAGPFENGCDRCLPAGILAGVAAYRAGRFARSLPVPGAAAAVRAGVKTMEVFTPSARTREATLTRLEHMREAARHVSLFLAPSQTIADWFLRFGIDRARLRRCRQGIDVRRFANITRQPSRVLRIGYAGGLMPSKAPEVLLKAVARLPPGSASVDLLGSVSARQEDADYVRALSPLLGQPFVRRLGPVPHDRMPLALAAIDVLAVPSVWIENAPFIIHEAFAAHVPVVASNLGGMAEMVKHGVDGLLFDAGDAEALSVQLRRLLDEAGLLERLTAAIQPPLSMEEDAATLRQIYEDLQPQPDMPSARRALLAAHPRSAGSVAAVVLNYRTPEQTWLAARSVQSSLHAITQLIVVDNGSDDGSAAALRTSLPTADVVETGANLGYSGGCNVGIRRALDRGAAFVLLVNSDAVLAPDAVDILLEAANRDPSAGILAPVLLSREEPDRIASAGIAFSGRSGRMRHRAAGQPLALLEPAPALTVDAVSACVMLVRREVFDEIGWLDEEYFFSFEDIDFCLRAADAGFRTVCVPDAIAYHEGGRSIGRRSPRRVYFATRNHLRLAHRVAPRRGAAVMARGGFIVGLNAAYVLLAPEVPLVSGMAAVARGTWHHLCRRYGSD